MPKKQNIPGGYVSPHFRETEFACNHCGSLGDGVNMDLVDILEKTRTDLGGRVVTLNSAYRCPLHNAAVGGARNSQHLYGTAVDIVVDGVAPKAVYSYFQKLFPNRYGLGQYNSFTHFDVRKGGAARW